MIMTTRLYLLLDLDRLRTRLLEDYGYRDPATAIAAIKAETGFPIVLPADQLARIDQPLSFENHQQDQKRSEGCDVMRHDIRWTIFGLVVGVIVTALAISLWRPTGRYQFAVMEGGGLITMDTTTGEMWANGPGLRAYIGRPWDSLTKPTETSNRFQALLDSSEKDPNGSERIR